MREGHGPKGVKLTASEWNVLTCLWEDSPRTVMQLVADLSERVGWAKSTTITTLRRMEEKGLVHAGQAGRGQSYTPAVEREQADEPPEAAKSAPASGSG